METLLHDHQQIASLTARVAHHVDADSWTELRALFSNQVQTDYTSLFGGEVQIQDSDALIETWRKMLTPLDATQHLLGPVDTEIEGDTASAKCHVRAYHVLRRAPGGSEWMVAGQYEFGLVKTAGEWKIRSMKLNTFYQTGNQKLLEEAAASRR